MTEERVRLDDVEVRLQTCEVYVDRSRGRFYGVTPRGTETPPCLNYETVVDHLKSILTREKVRVSIPFVTGTLQRAVATGIHAGNGSVLYDSDGSRGLQLEAWRYGTVLRDMSDEELAEGRRLREEFMEAKRVLDDWTSKHVWPAKFSEHVSNAVAGKEPDAEAV